MENKVKLSSQDGLVLEVIHKINLKKKVQKEVAIKSHLISTIIEDTGLEEEIPLPNVKFNILKKVM